MGKKTPKESPKPKGGDLVVPEHGRGRIRRGSRKGNTPGPGRPPSEIRARMRGSLVERLHIAEEIADDPKTSPADRMRALDFLAKYGMGTRSEVTGEDGQAVQVAHMAVHFIKPSEE